MSKRLIERLRADRDEIRSTADSILKKADEQGNLAEADQTNLDSLLTEAKALDTRIGELVQIEITRAEQDQIEGKFDLMRSQRAAGSDEPKATTLGEEFVKSDEFAAWSSTKSGSMAPIEVQTSKFATITTDGVPPKSRTSDAALPGYYTPLLDVIGREPVGSNAIEYISWPVSLPVAGVVAEGSPKGEATYAPTLVEETLKKYAHTIPMTREAMEDIPRIESVVSTQLMRGVWRKVETDAAAALVAATLPTAEGATLLEAIRVGLGSAQGDGWAADTVVLNPADYAEIDIELLSKTLNGARANSPVWGLRVIPAYAVAAGTAYVGEFATGMTLFDRGVAAIYATDSHASEFTSNIVRLLAEARALPAVVRAEAIYECTVTP